MTRALGNRREERLKAKRRSDVHIFAGLILFLVMAVMALILPALQIKSLSSAGAKEGILRIESKQAFRSQNAYTYAYEGKVDGHPVSLRTAKNLQPKQYYSVTYDPENPSDLVFGGMEESILQLYLREGNPAVIVICLVALPLLVWGAWSMRPGRPTPVEVKDTRLPLP